MTQMILYPASALRRRPWLYALVLLSLLLPTRPGLAQETRVRDLTITGREVPVRLVGYGLVVGLDGTGDRAMGRHGATHTVRSVVNLLRNFSVEVPEEFLRTRNVAAVLVTGEVSPYLRPGGRFNINVASLGDATSLRGGMLWTTPLIAEAGGTPVATAQGQIVMSDGDDTRALASRRWGRPGVETSARLPDGGVLEYDLVRPEFTPSPLLVLREPDLGTAMRIARVINDTFGEATARVEDPGAIALDLPESEGIGILDLIGDLTVTPNTRPRILIDGRDGTVVAGGDLRVREAVVSHGGMTLTIGGLPTVPDGDDELEMIIPGDLRLAPGTSVQEVAAALHAVAARPSAIGAIFEALRSVGAIDAEVVIR